jgi:hypothetical protein
VKEVSVGEGEDAGVADVGGAEIDEGDEGSRCILVCRRVDDGGSVSLQQMDVQSNGGGVDYLLRLLRTTAHRDARVRLPRATTRFDGGVGRWARNSRTFEALTEDD